MSTHMAHAMLACWLAGWLAGYEPATSAYVCRAVVGEGFRCVRACVPAHGMVRLATKPCRTASFTPLGFPHLRARRACQYKYTPVDGAGVHGSRRILLQDLRFCCSFDRFGLPRLFWRTFQARAMHQVYRMAHTSFTAMVYRMAHAYAALPHIYRTRLACACTRTLQARRSR